MEMLFLSLSRSWCARGGCLTDGNKCNRQVSSSCLGPGVQEGVAGQMGINGAGMFLLAYLSDVLSVSLLNQVYRLQPLPPTSLKLEAWMHRCSLDAADVGAWSIRFH
jgi:hypothetical protein